MATKDERGSKSSKEPAETPKQKRQTGKGKKEGGTPK